MKQSITLSHHKSRFWRQLKKWRERLIELLLGIRFRLYFGKFRQRFLLRNIHTRVWDAPYQLHRSGLICSFGVQYLITITHCDWLIDAIAAHQPIALEHFGVDGLQKWSFDFIPPAGGLVLCINFKEDDKLFHYVDEVNFPLDSIIFFIKNDVICLPAEYA